jgi:hypothetical protein
MSSTDRSRQSFIKTILKLIQQNQIDFRDSTDIQINSAADKCLSSKHKIFQKRLNFIKNPSFCCYQHFAGRGFENDYGRST